MKNLQVGLVGYYGWGNYGDEFFKYVLDSQLPQSDFQLLHGIGDGGKLLLEDIEPNLEKVDVVMIGGGDLVIPYALSSLYWRPEFLRKPVVIYGVGVPRWGGYDHEVVMKMRAFFQHPAIKHVTARDQESADWISAHLKPSAKVDCEPDIVCAYQHPYIAPRDRAFGLVLRYQGGGVDGEQVRLILDRVRARGYHPRVLMLATDKTLKDDFDTVSKLDLGDADIIVRTDLRSLTDELLACDRVASMKFHGCVVAMTHNVPCLALSAANKFKNFYAELDMNEWVSSLADAALMDKLDQFLRTPSYEFPVRIREQARVGLDRLQAQLQAAADEGVPAPEPEVGAESTAGAGSAAATTAPTAGATDGGSTGT